MISNVLLLASASAFWAAIALLLFWRIKAPRMFAIALYWISSRSLVWARAVEASIHEERLALVEANESFSQVLERLTAQEARRA